MVTSHLGRPKEGVFEESEIRSRRSRSTFRSFSAWTCRSSATGSTAWRSQPGRIVLLENCRFNKGEKKNDEALSKKMAALCDVYVNDAFGTAHRAEATTHGIAQLRAKWPAPARSWRRRSKRSGARWRALRGRSSRSSAARRCRPSSRSSVRSRRKWISSSSAAASPTRSCWRQAGRSASRSRSRSSMGEAQKISAALEAKARRAVPVPVDVVCGKELSPHARARR